MYLKALSVISIGISKIIPTYFLNRLYSSVVKGSYTFLFLKSLYLLNLT